MFIMSATKELWRTLAQPLLCTHMHDGVVILAQYELSAYE